jgi:hypothetical protein
MEKTKFGPYNWLVLERKGNTALLITENVLQSLRYDMRKGTWEKCEIRKYLNGEFLETFSEADRARIIEVTNENADNPWFKPTKDKEMFYEGGTGGKPTKDKVFLLSLDEVCRYFGDSTAKLGKCAYQQAAEGKFVPVDPASKKPPLKDGVELWAISDGNDKNRIAIDPAKPKFKESHWWLRSPGNQNGCAANIDNEGKVWVGGHGKSSNYRLRPALWIKM